jgi:hypothetical protein
LNITGRETTSLSFKALDIKVPRSNNPPRNPQDPGFFWGFHGSSISVNGSGDQIYPVPAGTCQNRRPDTVTGSLHRICGIFRRVPAGNGEFPEVFLLELRRDMIDEI